MIMQSLTQRAARTWGVRCVPLWSIMAQGRTFSTSPALKTSPVVVVQGASRGIGAALAKFYLENTSVRVLATCRNPKESSGLLGPLLEQYGPERINVQRLDVLDESSIESAAGVAKSWADAGGVHLLYNVAGVLVDPSLEITAEKRVGALSQIGATNSFLVNAIGPMLVAKHFGPLLIEKRRLDKKAEDSSSALTLEDLRNSVLPAQPTGIFFSARVGSTGDNQAGGWYSYRSSKAALNSFVKTLSLELKQKKVCVTVVHPGTVDTDLTRTFLKARSKYEVQPVDEAAKNLAEMTCSLTQEDSGTFLDWQREKIEW